MDTASIPRIITILPLPHLVFFPHIHVSLHIPRPFFDRMQEKNHPQGCFLGIVLRKLEPVPVSETGILPIGCVGRVIRFYKLPSGKSVHLDLHGLKRFWMKEGWFQDSYGQALIEVIDDPPGRLDPHRKKYLLNTMKDLGYMRHMAPQLAGPIMSEVDDDVLLNSMCLESGLSPMEKYFLLEANDLDQRCGRLLDLLRFRMEAIQSNGGACQKDK